MNLARVQPERASGEAESEAHVLVLYVVGGRPASRRAVSNLRAICEQQLKDRYTLEVIDLRQQPALAGEHDILAAPTLMRERPLPIVRLIGDLSDRDLVLATLDLQES